MEKSVRSPSIHLSIEYSKIGLSEVAGQILDNCHFCSGEGCQYQNETRGEGDWLHGDGTCSTAGFIAGTLFIFPAPIPLQAPDTEKSRY